MNTVFLLAHLIFILMNTYVCVCLCVSDLDFHISIGFLRAERHLFLELLQCHICLLDLLPLALPGPVQLALHLSWGTKNERGISEAKATVLHTRKHLTVNRETFQNIDYKVLSSWKKKKSYKPDVGKKLVSKPFDFI